MKLHLEKDDFVDAVTKANYQTGIRTLYIEKDYWVTYILKNLSNSEFADQVVFKGGTSLSKAHKIVERFSEDIDLALLLKGDETGGQIKNLIKRIEAKLMSSPFEINNDHELTSKGSKFRKTAYSYPRFIEDDDFGHAYDNLILEINSFANPTPYKKMKISSILGDFIKGVSEELIDKYELHDFSVNVLDMERTFTEKVMGLVRAGYAENPINGIRERIRHIYDLHKLLDTEDIKKLLNGDFHSMIEAVRDDDRKNSQFQGPWMDKKLSGSLLFNDPKEVMKQLDSYYHDTFSTLVYGELPKVDDVVVSIKRISEELKKN
ncbi:MAG: nucleotidyl transferase AbiEii/AbiGii toxin family protein [Bacteriovoracaceae bacterium]|nr:nucleotidyl transferase AbiEii/AbiGii toxin family protein [Bacteriovoracaceae bacterium]